MLVLARFVQQIVGRGIALEPLGAQVKRLAEALQGRGRLSQHGFESGEVIPGFGLVGNEGDNFLEDAFEFGQVAQIDIFLGNETGLAEEICGLANARSKSSMARLVCCI